MLQKSAEKKALRDKPGRLFIGAVKEKARMPQNTRIWIVAERERFIEVLTETGNPAIAADAINKSLASAYRLRERLPKFAADWRQALGNAWEQVEMRLLSSLLDGDAGKIDAKIALEMLKRRTPAPTRPIVTIDAARIARIRSEIRALAGPGD